MIRLLLSIQASFVLVASAQPIDARDELIFPVNPPRSASPDKKSNIVTKPFPFQSSPSSGVPTALPEKPDLKITKAEMSETDAETKELKATVSYLSSNKLVPSDVRVMCYIYESDPDGNISITSSKIVPNWSSPPIDWVGSTDEELTLQYKGPIANSGLKYAGCALGIYLGDHLQDAWASTPTLLSQFPFPATQQLVRSAPLGTPAPQKSPSESDRFLAAYKLFQETERSVQAGEFIKAKETIKEALSVLVTLQRDNPAWEPLVVEYRIASAKKLLAKIEEK